MGSNQIVFSAQRWRVFLWFACSVAVGLGFALAARDTAFSPSSSFHGRAALLGLLPPQGRLALLAIVAVFLCFMGVMLLRFLIDPKTVVIGDDGIEVFNVWSSRRGRWEDFDRVAVRTVRQQRFVSLKFRTASSGEASVGLNLRVMGIPIDSVLAEAEHRLKIRAWERRVPPAAGNLALPAVRGQRAGRKTFGRRMA